RLDRRYAVRGGGARPARKTAGRGSRRAACRLPGGAAGSATATPLARAGMARGSRRRGGRGVAYAPALDRRSRRGGCDHRPRAALCAGRFPVCHPSPYYEALGEFAWVGNDLAEGIRWALSHPEQVLERLGRGQDYVARVHAPAAVARGWIEIFRKIA